ncbi:MAG: hypothetical protein HYZ16_00850 [Bacteroidetes bacterium]|nr:hypothetical protein [Bacteroidota bacterium]
MRLRNIPDQTVAQQIQDGQKDILVAIFERNLATCLNLGIKYQLSDKQVHQFLAQGAVAVWYFFSKKPWLTSRHKIDFMVEYVFVRLVQRHVPTAKGRYLFEELDPYVQRVEEHANPVEPALVNNLTLLSDNLLQSLTLSLGDGRGLWNVGQLMGKSEEQVETMVAKAAIKWFGLLRQNLQLPLDTDGIKKDVDQLMSYHLGLLSPTDMASIEVALSTNPHIARTYKSFLLLDSTVGHYRTTSLLGMVLGKSAKRLTGNIWGNRWSVASAIFIALVGLLIWYAKRHQLPATTPNPNVETHDAEIR